MIVDDIINITYINPLRGENCNKFGPRFIDLSQTCNKDLSKELEQKGGYKRGVFHVNIELKNDNNVLEREIFSGSMLCLLAACHQGHIVVGMAAPDGKAMCAIEKTWIGDSAEACCESTCCCSCKKWKTHCFINVHFDIIAIDHSHTMSSPPRSALAITPPYSATFHTGLPCTLIFSCWILNLPLFMAI